MRLPICGMPVLVVLVAAAPAFAESADWKQCADVNNKGAVSQSLAACNRILKDPREAKNYAMAFRNRCGIRYTNGDYEQALADCNQAAKMDPQSAILYNRRGLIWYQKGDMGRAIVDYDQAIRINPQHSIAFNNRGLAFATKKEYDRAIRDYDQAIRFDPNYARAIHNRGLARRANGDSAGADIARAKQLDPNIE